MLTLTQHGTVYAIPFQSAESEYVAVRGDEHPRNSDVDYITVAEHAYGFTSA
jgi:hypothetical protein